MSMDIKNINRAAELEQYLKSMINSITYRDLIKDIKVEADDTGSSLNVIIVPLSEAVTFGRISVRLTGAATEPKWRRMKKDAYSQVNGARPGVSALVKEVAQKETGEKLYIWRSEHPFSVEMTEFLSSNAAAVYFSRSRIDILRFLAGNESPVFADAEIGTETITAAFNIVPVKAVIDMNTGRIRVSLSEANALYKKLERVVEHYKIQTEIEAYLSGKEISASVVYTGHPGEFRISFPFDVGTETETVTVEKAYKRIVSGAYRTARARADSRRKEQEGYLKTCPAYGTFVAQAVLDTIEDNGNRLTAGQIINILRGSNLSREFVFGKYTGKYKLLQKSEIIDVIAALEHFGIIHMRCVRGQFQNYYVYGVSQTGRLFAGLQNTPVPRKSPSTEQEYYLVLKAVRDDIERITDRKKLELLQVITEKPAIFLTDPALILDIVEHMGETAEGYLKKCYAKEDRRTRRDVLRLLVNAASGKGKVFPPNGLTAFREREEKKKQAKEELKRRDEELFRLVLTEIPDNYVDLYPAARSMSRHFVLHIGPTNSGKTHDAIEELIQADNGIYLAPLRLLAYEQYERMNRAECPCSLVTGEENN